MCCVIVLCLVDPDEIGNRLVGMIPLFSSACMFADSLTKRVPEEKLLSWMMTHTMLARCTKAAR